ncbi:MAG TPA: DedA family protein, partial [Solirubrobacteraceae bacterium]|nr:DedA family protein [Solirubrobacteraceae bacterium]
MKPVWLVVAVALAAFLVWRRRRLEPTLIAGGVIVAIGSLVYGLGVVHLPNLEEALIDVGETLGSWTYVLVGALAFFETGAFIGLVAPGETAMLLGGLVAGQGQVDVITMIAIAWAAAVAGDLTSFYLGRRLGRAFLVKHGPKVQITEPRLRQVEAFFDKHGGKAILIGRFVGLVRAIAPFLAGSSGMPLRRFVPYDVVGAGLWSSTFIVLGYIFWQSFSQLVDYAKKGALALGAVIVLVVAIVWAFRWLRDPENRARAREWLERQAERPALRPLARVARPVLRRSRRPARFVWDRVTPGDLGLELTTLMAVASVGSFL